MKSKLFFLESRNKMPFVGPRPAWDIIIITIISIIIIIIIISTIRHYWPGKKWNQPNSFRIISTLNVQIVVLRGVLSCSDVGVYQNFGIPLNASIF